MTFKDLKSQTGMTQQQLADFLNIPKRTIENWDSGTSKCPPYVLELIEYKLLNEGKIKR